MNSRRTGVMASIVSPLSIALDVLPLQIVASYSCLLMQTPLFS
jgi:hypothetical protein